MLREYSVSLFLARKAKEIWRQVLDGKKIELEDIIRELDPNTIMRFIIGLQEQARADGECYIAGIQLDGQAQPWQWNLMRRRQGGPRALCLQHLTLVFAPSNANCSAMSASTFPG